MTQSACRFCRTGLVHQFVDLGCLPFANYFPTVDDLGTPDPVYPLKAFVCEQCLLVQLTATHSPKTLFSDYPYFSSYSDSWLRHAHEYTHAMVACLGLGKSSRVVEIGSNDGYLLQYFRDQQIATLGIEPAANVAEAAKRKGIETKVEFFNRRTACELVQEGWSADLLIANNVLAHVPDLNDFLAATKTLLQPDGVLTVEVPHLMRLLEHTQFDTIYHEHFSYFSLATIERIFSHHSMVVFDVEELDTHGGSLRLYIAHTGRAKNPVSERLAAVRQMEVEIGMTTLEPYLAFQTQVENARQELGKVLKDISARGGRIAAYGAPAQGSILLHYCNIGPELVDYTVDRNPMKQGRYLPGTRIPIHEPGKITQTRPDFLLILPWNLKTEIMEQMTEIRVWGGKFIVPVPHVEVIE